MRFTLWYAGLIICILSCSLYATPPVSICQSNSNSTGLVALYHFNVQETSNTDASGNGNFATINSTSPSNVAAKFGNGYFLRGTRLGFLNEWFSLPTLVSDTDTAAGTINLWFNPSRAYNANTDTDRIDYFFYHISDIAVTALVFLRSSNAVYAGWFKTGYDERAVFTMSSDADWGINTWSMWTLTWDSTAQKQLMYRNGALVATSNNCNNIADIPVAPRIGWDGYYVIGGTVDEFKVYNVVLSTAEIYDRYYKNPRASE